jgi:hypothetical protein
VNIGPRALCEPRSFGGVAFRIGAMVMLPFALLMSWLVSCLLGYEFGQVLPFGLAGSLVFGTIFGLNNARYLQLEHVRLEMGDRKEFLGRLNLVMSSLGYYPAQGNEGFHLYQPSFLTGWAAGGVVAQELGSAVELVGPRVFVLKALELLAQRSSR